MGLFSIEKNEDGHWHKTAAGIAVHCYHKSISLGKMIFVQLVITTVSFPWEHYAFEKIWPLNLITKWLGL